MSGEEDFADVLDAARRRVRRSARGAVIGGAIGALSGVLLFVTPDPGDDLGPLPLLLYIATAALIGASIGSIIGGGRLQKLVNTTVGFDIASERIKNAVRGTETALPEAERPRAVRYATISSVVLPAQIRLWGLLTAASVAGDLARFTSSTGQDSTVNPGVTAVVGLITSALFLRITWQNRTARRQADTYLAGASGA